VLIFPEKEAKDSGFVDRESRYAKRWLASMGIYQPEEPYDPYWGELVSFFASIRENKAPVVALEIALQMRWRSLRLTMPLTRPKDILDEEVSLAASDAKLLAGWPAMAISRARFAA